MTRLTNQVVIITGSGAGIGKEITFTFARQGAKIVMADFNETALQATVLELQQTAMQELMTKCKLLVMLKTSYGIVYLLLT
ncbi:hypothetical protein KSI01_12130 [Kurthia sibirica]|uniref:Uncharacterized protein n=1 Tax=Kurthia sibirica TaxID=202750 RepID=A0A2U3AMC7_9BACL|nr:hypothetical protein DEX24_07135 [Kurthia sibirica]GEK33680.1 hypothetical protein KSI01_12130 [Kurthia sibirica]